MQKKITLPQIFLCTTNNFAYTLLHIFKYFNIFTHFTRQCHNLLQVQKTGGFPKTLPYSKIYRLPSALPTKNEL